jgi:hypothetical protein
MAERARAQSPAQRAAGDGAAGETAHVRVDEAPAKRADVYSAQRQKKTNVTGVLRQHTRRRIRRQPRQYMRREPRDRQRQPKAEAREALGRDKTGAARVFHSARSIRPRGAGSDNFGDARRTRVGALVFWKGPAVGQGALYPPVTIKDKEKRATGGGHPQRPRVDAPAALSHPFR